MAHHEETEVYAVSYLTIQTSQCKVFFWIQVADLADYLLTYNTNWIGPLNFNIIAVLIFATSIFYEYGRDRD